MALDPGRTSVILVAGAGGRSLVRTADSVARQSFAASELLLASPTRAGSTLPLAASVVLRLNAVLIQAGCVSHAAAVNTAAGRASGEYLAIVPEGFTLHRRFIEVGATALDGGNVSALALPILLRTADGLGVLSWHPSGVDAAAILADPRSVGPVFFIRRSAWHALGGLDDSLDSLAEYDLWVRLVLGGHSIAVVADALVSREMPVATDPSVSDDRVWLSVFRSILEKHRAAVDPVMVELLTMSELRFGVLRERHARLVSRRDAELAELERLRSEAAHQKAYVEHHGSASLEWGDLRRTDPVSRDWGYDRGVPIDRRYIEDFLAAHSSDIGGDVIEVQENDFTRALGGPRVMVSGVVDIDAGNPRATILADLRCAPELPSDFFDCVILTQTLHVIDDMPAVVRECYRTLKPGGVLLATVPAASRVCLEYGEEGDFWRATPAGARALVEPIFGPAVECATFGNVLTNVAFLQGLACGEVTGAEFDATDPYFPVLTGIRARKTASRSHRGVVLLYHRVDATPDAYSLGVPPVLFDAHMRWLKANCGVVPLEDLLTAPPDSLPDRAVALTFDDGYVDNLLEAAPALQRLGLPATFFLTSRWLDCHGEYWWDGLERILLGSATVPAVFDSGVAGFPAVQTASADDRSEAHALLHTALVHASLEDRETVMGALDAWSGGGLARVRPMTADELGDLARFDGVSIGSHTVNHLALPDQSARVRHAELVGCSEALSRIVGRSVELFAYPYGALDRDVAGQVRRSCRWGLGCDERLLPDSFDAARVPRVEVKPWEVGSLAARLNQFFGPRPPSGYRVLTPSP